MKGLIFAVALLGGLAPVAAVAGLDLCNEASARHSVAVGYKSGDQWISEGWWNLDPGSCVTPIAGDLKYRYFYYRAEASTRRFLAEGYEFCTQRAAFTIEGDTDCVDRGYVASEFAQIDTGDALDFTFSFTDAVSPQKADEAEPLPPETGLKTGPLAGGADTATTGTSAPGTWGEPYASGSAIFQDCVSETEAPFCSFHADGTKFYVYDDGRTPVGILQAMRSYLPGTPIEVQGDLEAIHDRSADIVLRHVSPRAYTYWDTTLSKLQGTWYSPEDPDSQFTIIGSELDNTYDGAYLGRDYLSMRDRCEFFDGHNLLVWTEEETGDLLCYSIEELGAFNMTLMYLPRGNFLHYRKLD
ncbi:DUF1036 domain-containing protein [Antarcticimicrobium sediminis]|uniref:DUF1036 domain-containing protein n=1 Tax=Antarcticimicrobium sediminis TaxID=2546227 RepID=A0A4R5F1P7_9RHOB|nr:DUF1036 domain-containing protein [Antarcticimicrobium sediminis]TDE41222.1 DUF1036 domain-containing protein [Antarcticimicrobium sediminis]